MEQPARRRWEQERDIESSGERVKCALRPRSFGLIDPGDAELPAAGQTPGDDAPRLDGLEGFGL